MRGAQISSFVRWHERTSNARTLSELIVGYTLILLAIWTPGITQRLFMFTAACWIAVTSLRDNDVLYGLRPSHLRHSWWILVAAAALSTSIVAVAVRLETFQIPVRYQQSPARTLGYIVWSFVQQFILQDYFLLRLRRLLANARAAVLAAAFLFSVAHLPSPLLTVAALFWGIASCALFLRYRDLYSLAVAHAILGLCILVTVPDRVHHQMRVGLGYLQYHAATYSAQPQ